jgi:alanine-glyoxylate transaminase/serine-glyoxylate transaminase/serine-pyruvate transaminase
VPDGIDELSVRQFLLDHYNVEIGAGLGKFKGNAWRIGLMGASASRQHVSLCLTALGQALRAQGFAPEADALAASAASYDAS